MPSRTRIELEWGASLYSGEVYQELKRPGSITVKSSQLNKEQAWPQLATSAMTSMVISLDYIQLMKELLVTQTYNWDLQNYASFMTALEASHWHAFCFNENSALRLQLQQRGFMNKNRSSRNISADIPHLLEQEVLSMEQMLFTTFRLYCYSKHNPLSPGSENKTGGAAFNGNQSAAFAEPYVER